MHAYRFPVLAALSIAFLAAGCSSNGSDDGGGGSEGALSSDVKTIKAYVGVTQGVDLYQYFENTNRAGALFPDAMAKVRSVCPAGGHEAGCGWLNLKTDWNNFEFGAVNLTNQIDVLASVQVIPASSFKRSFKGVDYYAGDYVTATYATSDLKNDGTGRTESVNFYLRDLQSFEVTATMPRLMCTSAPLAFNGNQPLFIDTTPKDLPGYAPKEPGVGYRFRLQRCVRDGIVCDRLLDGGFTSLDTSGGGFAVKSNPMWSSVIDGGWQDQMYGEYTKAHLDYWAQRAKSHTESPISSEFDVTLEMHSQTRREDLPKVGHEAFVKPLDFVNSHKSAPSNATVKWTIRLYHAPATDPVITREAPIHCVTWD